MTVYIANIHKAIIALRVPYASCMLPRVNGVLLTRSCACCNTVRYCVCTHMLLQYCRTPIQ